MELKVKQEVISTADNVNDLNLRLGDLVIVDLNGIENKYTNGFLVSKGKTGRVPLSAFIPRPAVVDIGNIKTKVLFKNEYKSLPCRISLTNNEIEFGKGQVSLKGLQQFLSPPVDFDPDLFHNSDVKVTFQGNLAQFETAQGNVSIKEVADSIFRMIREKQDGIRILLSLNSSYFERIFLCNLAQLANHKNVECMYFVSAMGLAASKLLPEGTVNYLVMSSGAVSTDIALFTKNGQKLSMRAAKAIEKIGGQHISCLIYEHVVSQFVLTQQWEKKELLDECDRAKCSLATATSANIPIPNSSETYSLDRKILNYILQPAIDSLYDTILNLLLVSDLVLPDISHIFLAGQNCSLKPISELFTSVLPHCPVKFISENDILIGSHHSLQMELSEQVGRYFGIQLEDDMFAPVLNANSKSDLSGTRYFCSGVCQYVVINIFEGSYRLCDFNRFVGSIRIESSNYFSGNNFQVKFELDEFGLLAFTVKDSNTQRLLHYSVFNSYETMGMTISAPPTLSLQYDYERQVVPLTNLEYGPTLTLNLATVGNSHMEYYKLLSEIINSAKDNLLSLKVYGIIYRKLDLHSKILNRLTMDHPLHLDSVQNDSLSSILHELARLESGFAKLEDEFDLSNMQSLTSRFCQLEIEIDNLNLQKSTTKPLSRYVNNKISLMKLQEKLHHSVLPIEGVDSKALLHRFNSVCYSALRKLVKRSNSINFIPKLLVKDAQLVRLIIKRHLPYCEEMDFKIPSQFSNEDRQAIQLLSDLIPGLKETVDQFTFNKLIPAGNDGGENAFRTLRFYEESLIKLQLKADSVTNDNPEIKQFRKQINVRFNQLLSEIDEIRTFLSSHY